MHKVFFVAVMAGLSWAAATPEPNVPRIVTRSMQETTANWNQASDYSFIERDVETKRGSQPLVKTYQVLQIDGSPYIRVIAVGDRPLSATEQDQEERKLRNEMEKRQRQSEGERAKRVEKYVKGRRQDRALLDGMMGAFDFQLVGQETIDGRDCWLLNASPKAGYQPKSRETKVLAGMRGRLWVDKASGHWVRVQAEVFQSVSLYGFFAKVQPGTRFLLEQEPVTGSLWLPKHLSMHVNASAFGLVHEDSTDDETYSNYKPMPEALSLLGAH